MWLEPGNKNKSPTSPPVCSTLLYGVSRERLFFGKNLANEATWIIKSWRKSGRELEEVVAALPSFPGSKHVLKRNGEGETFSSPKCGGRGRKRKNKIIRSKLNSWSTLVEVGKDLFQLARRDYFSLWTTSHTHSAAAHHIEQKCNNIL